MKNRFSQKVAYLLAFFSILVYLSVPEKEIIPVFNYPEYEDNLMIFMMDKDEMLIPISIGIEEKMNLEESMKQVIEWMSHDFLFESFYSILPEQCQLIDVSIENNHADLIFNEELLNFAPEKEKKIIETLVWTMTQFDSISSISLWINEDKLIYLPYQNTKTTYLTPSIGINNFTSSVSELHDTIPVHIVYDKPINGNLYKVILTKRIEDKKEFSLLEEALFDEVMNQYPYQKRLTMIQNGNLDNDVFHLYLDESVLLDESTLDMTRLDNLLYTYFYTFNIERFTIHVDDHIIRYNDEEVIDVSKWTINETMF